MRATVNPSVCMSYRLAVCNVRGLWPNTSTDQANVRCVGYP